MEAVPIEPSSIYITSPLMTSAMRVVNAMRDLATTWLAALIEETSIRRRRWQIAGQRLDPQ